MKDDVATPNGNPQILPTTSSVVSIDFVAIVITFRGAVQPPKDEPQRIAPLAALDQISRGEPVLLTEPARPELQSSIERFDEVTRRTSPLDREELYRQRVRIPGA